MTLIKTDEIASRPLPLLRELGLFSNAIGDYGMIAFAEAVRSVAMANLLELWLAGNQIGDVGLTALAEAVRSGAMEEGNRRFEKV